MVQYALGFAAACFGLAILMNLWMVLRTPLVQDRILALDTMFVNAIALVVLYGVFLQSGTYFEVAVLMAMTGFVSTVALAKYLLRGGIIE
ncbi:MAG: K+/H+ antiporter subunit F [Gemmobacter sp.]